MKNFIAGLVFCFPCTFVMAQSPAQQPPNAHALSDTAWARAGCGSDDIHWDVKVDKTTRPSPQPETGKAIAYVFEDDFTRSGMPTTRVGLDGKWRGGNVPQTYFYFTVDPGTHRLCSNWQGTSTLGAALDFTAEAGKTYYFRTKVSIDGFEVRQVQEAEAQFLVATHYPSVSSQKEKIPIVPD